MQTKVAETHLLIVDAMDRYIQEIKSLNMHKLFVILSVSGILLIIQRWIEMYLFHDWNYLLSLFILIAIDTATGFMKAVKQNVVSSVKFGRLFIKVFLYVLVLIVVNVLITFKVQGAHPSVFDWMEVFILTALMFREAISVFENVAIIYPTLLPRFVMRRLEQFDENGFEMKTHDREEKKELEEGEKK